MPTTVFVQIRGKEFFELRVEKVQQVIEKGVANLGQLALTRMHNEIKSRTKRRGSTGNLVRSIDLESFKTPNRLEITVGNVEKMSSMAPYWSVINYGVTRTGAKFIPGMLKTRPYSFDDGFANPSLRGKGSGKMLGHTRLFSGDRPPSAVRPMRYIERTQSWLINYWDGYWASTLSKV